MLKILILGLVALATADKATFNGYKVIRVLPMEDSHVQLLRDLEHSSTDYTFWNGPTYANRTVDVMVAPHKMPDFKDVLSMMKTPFLTYIHDVQSLIDEEERYVARDDSYHNRYHRLDEIYAYLEGLASRYPEKLEVVVGGRSYEGREIKGVKLVNGPSKPGIFIEGGIHAREWISPATVTYILDQLLHSDDPDVRQLADSHNWYIFPVFNPDGYEYTHTTNRMWRKTRQPYKVCHGADPNRNFPYKWMQGGASSNPCVETFAGSHPTSEVEIRTMVSYMKSIKDKFFAFISFHSYSQLLLFPYGHTTAHLENYDDLYSIGKKSIDALAKRYGTQYVTGNIAETIYVATGSSVDFVKGSLGKPIAYTYELRDRGRHGFLLPPSQIVPTGEEVLDSLVAMFKEASNLNYPH